MGNARTLLRLAVTRFLQLLQRLCHASYLRNCIARFWGKKQIANKPGAAMPRLGTSRQKDHNNTFLEYVVLLSPHCQ